MRQQRRPRTPRKNPLLAPSSSSHSPDTHPVTDPATRRHIPVVLSPPESRQQWPKAHPSLSQDPSHSHPLVQYSDSTSVDGALLLVAHIEQRLIRSGEWYRFIKCGPKHDFLRQLTVSGIAFECFPSLFIFIVSQFATSVRESEFFECLVWVALTSRNCLVEEVGTAEEGS